MLNLRFSQLIFALLVLAVMVGCGEESSQPPSGQRPAKAVKAKKVPKKAVAVKKQDAKVKKEEEVVYFYDPSGKTDPFFPILVEKAAEKEEEMIATETGEPKTFLETLELSQLKLVAVMIMGKRRIAMVEDPEGKGHTIYIGTPIGKSGGKVAGIAEGKVLIEEKYKKKGEIVPVIKELVIQSAEDKRR
ncbi:MAG: pilus assembly protein PilP [Deltaproteobacteria bacterium]|nr:pilus assembly protein PilP [Deltaproteobacteria bacterium]